MPAPFLTTPSNPRRTRIRPVVFWLMVCLLLAAHYLLAATAVRGKSVGFDEPAHITPGVSFWMSGDYRLNPSSGYLPMRVEGLAVWATASKLPVLKGELWDHSLAWAVSREWCEGLGEKYLETVYPGRLAAGFFSVFLGLAVACWSRKLFGDAGAIVSLVLYTFCPTMLGNGVLMTSDAAASLFFLLSLAAVWELFHHMTIPKLVIAGTALTCLALSKFSGVLILPVIAILIGLRTIYHRPIPMGWYSGREWSFRGPMRRIGVLLGAFGLLGLMVFGGIWAAYGFRYSLQPSSASIPPAFDHGWSVMKSIDSASAKLVLWIDSWHLLPQAFVQFMGINIYSTQGRSAFLNGEHSLIGWPVFFLYTFLVKTPLASLAVMVMAALGWGAYILKKGKGRRRDPSLLWFYRTAPLWVFVCVYMAVAVTSKINIGHRHILPVYAPLYILSGAAGWWLCKPRQWQALATSALLVLLMVETTLTWPNYLSYFNQSVGGSQNGYRHLVDSSLDWGQDLPALRTYLQREGLIAGSDSVGNLAAMSTDPRSGSTPVYLSYFGSVEPSIYGLHVRYLHSYFDYYKPQGPPQMMQGGVYCISATLLQNVYNQFPGHWNSAYEIAYKQLNQIVSEFANAPAGSEERRKLVELHGDKYWFEAFWKLDDIRFARLTAYLRKREPIHLVNGSILIYRVTDQDIREALTGPPPELDDSNVTE